jgi:hypothetical protein
MTAEDRSAVDAATRKKAVAAAVIGNFVEWYDFVIYAYFATVLATLFFPSESRFASLMATFAVFGVSFVVHPLGGFGHRQLWRQARSPKHSGGRHPAHVGSDVPDRRVADLPINWHPRTPSLGCDTRDSGALRSAASLAGRPRS